MRLIVEALGRLAGFVAGAAAALMMLHIALGVFLRVAFHAPLLGTNEIVSEFYMVALIFLGIFVASWRQAQIRVDVIADLFPAGLRRITDALAEIISLLFFVAFAWGLAHTALQKTAEHEQVDALFAYITVWPMRWVAVTGIGLAAFVALGRSIAMIPGKPLNETDASARRSQGESL